MLLRVIYVLPLQADCSKMNSKEFFLCIKCMFSSREKMTNREKIKAQAHNHSLNHSLNLISLALSLPSRENFVSQYHLNIVSLSDFTLTFKLTLNLRMSGYQGPSQGLGSQSFLKLKEHSTIR